MKKILILLTLFLFISCCKTDEQKLNELKRPIVIISITSENYFRHGIVMLKDVNGKMITLNHSNESDVLSKLQPNDTIK